MARLRCLSDLNSGNSNMRYFFSGIGSTEERDMLIEAGVQRLLVDPTDLHNANGMNAQVALDSGAYRAFKNGTTIDVDRYLEVARSRPFEFVVAPDVLGDMDATIANWNRVKNCGLPLVPVWQWGADEAILQRFLDEAPLVGIGACVPWMHVDQSRQRSKEDIDVDKHRRAFNFEKLKAICEQYGDRLHVFGLCWETAIEELADCLYSADSSHWLCGARKGTVIFQNTRTGRLSNAPARVLPFARKWDRRQRCVENAKAIAQFLGEPLAVAPALAKA